MERNTTVDASWHTSFGINVDLGSGLTQREKIILFNSARSCEVHKLLTGDMAFDYTLAGQKPTG